ncbi:MAG: DUF2752 domain-containing protein [Planctomycetota bacterium]|nr:MAG: DUF2752 domain-containing protein [Planctomycetota bacterium]GDY07442.1 hypothetical protein LBMAG52_09280 [Planctomycetia bacterium]
MSVSEPLPTLEVDEPCDRDMVPRRSHDVTMLCITVAVLVLSFALRVRADQRVELLGLSGLPAPEMCGSRLWFGLECPGCGLTRGFIRLASGDWSSAIALNRAAPLLAFAVLAQIPYRLAILFGWPPARRLAKSSWPNSVGWVLIVALFGNWLLKLFGV